MGQHKYNKTALAAKEGKLPPKEPKKTSTELRRETQEMLYNTFGRSRYMQQIFKVMNTIKNVDKY